MFCFFSVFRPESWNQTQNSLHFYISVVSPICQQRRTPFADHVDREKIVKIADSSGRGMPEATERKNRYPRTWSQLKKDGQDRSPVLLLTSLRRKGCRLVERYQATLDPYPPPDQTTSKPTSRNFHRLPSQIPNMRHQHRVRRLLALHANIHTHDVHDSSPLFEAPIRRSAR